MLYDVSCPYCDEPQEIDHDDGAGYEEGVTHRQECRDCGKTFVFTTNISYNYDAEKADCLNGEGHDWKPTSTQPKSMTRMNCTMCDEDRWPTAEEKAKYNIPLTRGE